MTKPFKSSARCYCLILRHSRDEEVTVGALGSVTWPAGWLFYVGRASHGWGSRLKRFLREDQQLHWHIDYLARSSHAERWGVLVYDTAPNRECDIARSIGGMAVKPIVDGFGASDCENKCRSHGWIAPASTDPLSDQLREMMPSPDGYVRFGERKSQWKQFPEIRTSGNGDPTK